MNFQQMLHQIERPFTFAVVGDTHFSHPKFYPDLEQDASSRRPLKVEKYIENVHYVLSPMMEALKAEAPAFVVLTGDLVEGHRDAQLAQEEMRAGLNFFDGYGMPVLVTRGNHDTVEAYDGVIGPYLGQQLGWKPEARYFFVDVAGCRLIFLDTENWRCGEAQSLWLERLLEQSEEIAIERTFLFGHYPIWPVSRAFFTNFEFQLELPRMLARYPVDAYFCGHTHNQSIVIHRTEGKPAFQFMSAPIGLPEEIPTPLNRVHTLLPSQEDLLDCWPGYLENTAPGWFTVRVGKRMVHVEWRHLNRGVETSVRWRNRGDALSFRKMEHPPDARLIFSDLGHIRRAFLRFCAWDAAGSNRRVFLNGEDVGVLPDADQYVPSRLELPTWALGQLRKENRLEIRVQDGEACTLGNLLLEAVLPGGRLVRTNPSREIFTWSNRWDAWRSERLHKLLPGRSAVTLLSFG
ncbi:MAG: metallophosphoesterase [bacterium]|nr:metallophosphoesterase [bacterium]